MFIYTHVIAVTARLEKAWVGLWVSGSGGVLADICRGVAPIERWSGKRGLVNM